MIRIPFRLVMYPVSRAAWRSFKQMRIRADNSPGWIFISSLLIHRLSNLLRWEFELLLNFCVELVAAVRTWHVQGATRHRPVHQTYQGADLQDAHEYFSHGACAQITNQLGLHVDAMDAFDEAGAVCVVGDAGDLEGLGVYSVKLVHVDWRLAVGPRVLPEIQILNFHRQHDTFSANPLRIVHVEDMPIQMDTSQTHQIRNSDEIALSDGCHGSYGGLAETVGTLEACQLLFRSISTNAADGTFFILVRRQKSVVVLLRAVHVEARGLERVEAQASFL
mmetsp:Transcript_28193/g.74399  ORF Transcript_28193/g.74399 Transcript_28193/m.74399 type:complete len:278 (-) Transcript_28193:653-1486(-)